MEETPSSSRRDHATFMKVSSQYSWANESSDRVVFFKDELIKTGEQFKLCRHVTLQVKQAAAHPANRDGTDISPEPAQSRVSKIKRGGFSLPSIRNNSVPITDWPLTKHIDKHNVADVC